MKKQDKTIREFAKIIFDEATELTEEQWKFIENISKIKGNISMCSTKRIRQIRPWKLYDELNKDMEEERRNHGI